MLFVICMIFYGVCELICAAVSFTYVFEKASDQQVQLRGQVFFAVTVLLHGLVLNTRAFIKIFPRHVHESTPHRFLVLDNWVCLMSIVFLAQYVTAVPTTDHLIDYLMQTWWSICCLLMLSRCFFCIIRRQMTSMVNQTVIEIPLFNSLELLPANTEECSICLDVNEELEWRLLPCSHMFHAQCVDTWLHQNNTCPCCRYFVSPV